MKLYWTVALLKAWSHFSQDNLGSFISITIKKQQFEVQKNPKTIQNKTSCSVNSKTRTWSLPDTVFLKGKLMILYREARAATWILAVVEWWSEAESTTSKVQTIVNCQRRSERESVEAWPSTGRSLQDISDMPLWLLKCSLNIHLEVSLIGKQRACVQCVAALGGARLEGKVIENEGWDCTSFSVQRRLCSHITKKKKKKM